MKKKTTPPIPGTPTQQPQVQLPSGDMTLNNCTEIAKFLMTVGQQYNALYQEYMKLKSQKK